MIPVRVAADLLDGQITWSARLQTATITTKGHIFLITVQVLKAVTQEALIHALFEVLSPNELRETVQQKYGFPGTHVAHTYEFPIRFGSEDEGAKLITAGIAITFIGKAYTGEIMNASDAAAKLKGLGLLQDTKIIKGKTISLSAVSLIIANAQKQKLGLHKSFKGTNHYLTKMTPLLNKSQLKGKPSLCHRDEAQTDLYCHESVDIADPNEKAQYEVQKKIGYYVSYRSPYNIYPGYNTMALMPLTNKGVFKDSYVNAMIDIAYKMGFPSSYSRAKLKKLIVSKKERHLETFKGTKIIFDDGSKNSIPPKTLRWSNQ
jgi:hypothetical protein